MIRYRDENWTEQEKRVDGTEAEIAQHECDHLDGRCISDMFGRSLRRQAQRLVLKHRR